MISLRQSEKCEMIYNEHHTTSAVFYVAIGDDDNESFMQPKTREFALSVLLLQETNEES